MEIELIYPKLIESIKHENFSTFSIFLYSAAAVTENVQICLDMFG
jgi:L-rhamnose mutarotase